MFDLPDPFGPTTQVIPGSNRREVAEAKDLNPRRVRLFTYTRGLSSPSAHGPVRPARMGKRPAGRLSRTLPRAGDGPGDSRAVRRAVARGTPRGTRADRALPAQAHPAGPGGTQARQRGKAGHPVPGQTKEGRPLPASLESSNLTPPSSPARTPPPARPPLA